MPDLKRPTIALTDALSRRPDHDDRLGDNDQMVALLDEVFARAVSTIALDKMVWQKQNKNNTKSKDG